MLVIWNEWMHVAVSTQSGDVFPIEQCAVISRLMLPLDTSLYEELKGHLSLRVSCSTGWCIVWFAEGNDRKRPRCWFKGKTEMARQASAVHSVCFRGCERCWLSNHYFVSLCQPSHPHPHSHSLLLLHSCSQSINTFTLAVLSWLASMCKQSWLTSPSHLAFVLFAVHPCLQLLFSFSSLLLHLFLGLNFDSGRNSIGFFF